jgi:hypothetical protein
MAEFIKYRRTQIAEMARWTPDFDMTRVSVSAPDKEAGSPTIGDMIARNPKNHADMWLVAAQYHADNFEPLYQSSSVSALCSAGRPASIIDVPWRASRRMAGRPASKLDFMGV